MTASEYDAELINPRVGLRPRPHLALVEASHSHLTAGRLRLKRAIDLVLSSLLIVASLPFVAVIAAAVKWGSPGPVLYRQHRVGKDGRLFVMIKFRTMRDGTHRAIYDDPDALQRYMANDFKLPPDDPRITRFGRLLRKSSLDELPQLLNILAGQMSLVGIRPIEPEQLALRGPLELVAYTTLRPGLTGLWQINGRSTMDEADRITLDTRYVETWSIRSDLAIILRTPLAMLNVRCTY